MPYPYDQVFAADPSNPDNVASNGVVTIFAPGDAERVPLAITTLDGLPLPNPLQVNDAGFGPAFMHDTLDQVAWAGGGFSGLFVSYKGIKDEAIAARVAAQESAQIAADAAAGATTPTAEAIERQITTEGSKAQRAVLAIAAQASEAKLDRTEATRTFAARPDNGETPVGKGELVINILDCGAVGDGVADDSAAFTEALRRLDSPLYTARELYLPPLTYNVLSRIKLISNLVIRGYGATIIKRDVSKGYVVFYGGSDGRKGYGSGASNIKVFGLRFLGNFETDAVICGFALNHSDNVVVEDCIFEQANRLGHCLDLTGCSNIEVNRCRFLGFKNSGGGYAKVECIQLDISAAGASSAVDLPGSWDGLPCRNVTVRGSQFLPLTVGGATYPAPNPLGTHAKHEGRIHVNIKFINNVVLEPSIDNVSDIRGALHFVGVQDLTIEGNTFEFTTPTTGILIGLYATNKGAAKGGNYEAGGVNPIVTIPPLKCSNVTIRNNTFSGMGNTQIAGPIRIEPLESGTSESEDIRLLGNRFEVLNNSDGLMSFIIAAYVNGLTVDEMNTFVGPGRPLDAKYIKSPSIGRNKATGSRASAFRVANSNNVKIGGLEVTDCAGAAVFVIDCTRVMFGPNTLHSVGDTGVMKLSNMRGFTIKQQDIKAPAGMRGIEVYGASTDGTASDNIIGGGTTAHIALTAGMANVSEKDNLKLTV